MTVTRQPPLSLGTDAARNLSLGTAAARNLATTTKTAPQMQGISSRWLLKALPWVQVSGGTYRVNRRLSYAVGDGRVSCVTTAAGVRVIPAELRELPALRGLADDEVLSALADRFVAQTFQPGDVIADHGRRVDQVCLIGHGKVDQSIPGEYGEQTVMGVLADGDHFGAHALADPRGTWPHTVRAVTACTVLALPMPAFAQLCEQSPLLRDHIEEARRRPKPAQNKKGEAEIALASGHHGEPELPGTFVAYETAPREYELSLAQTVLRVHSRVADLYNHPMDQLEQQLRLIVEALRERQEHELVNNPRFGLLHNADLSQRLHTREGPPTPDDLDELLTRRRGTRCFLAHPRTIAAFGRECSRRGIDPPPVDFAGVRVPAWRGVPMLPCHKIPISATNTSAILAMRTGEEPEGVIGLHQTGIPDEYEASLNVRFMGIDDKAIVSYLVSAYYSVAVLVPDALGVLENVELGR